MSGLKTTEHRCGFCVVGGGLAGICAAVSAARRGVKTILIHDRPVLGGNASSEIRMWICGCGGADNRETGLLEELSLASLYYNPYKLWPCWDAVLWDLVRREPDLTVLLNCSVCQAQMDEGRIVSVTGWQGTSQTWHTVAADQFADCSGDSILAPLTGADFRVGREDREEYGEDLAQEKADRRTMGNSCLIQARRLGHPVSFIAPPFARRLTAEDVKLRRPHLPDPSENFWYLELGGDRDTIGDAEAIRDDLVALAYGLWDYVKNSGEFDADDWQLDFVGYLPGKRESRRMTGDYVMTERDIVNDVRFEDTVAYGGWPLDDHDPAGFNHRSGYPNRSVPAPQPYCIPLGVLYSRSVSNLWFAGRNISLTHAAMSSARVMATCALVGQAVGEGAAVAAKYGVLPRQVREKHIGEVQQALMDDDCFLPHLRRRVSPLSLLARLACSAPAKNLEFLRSGTDRSHVLYGGSRVCSFPLGASVTYTFPARSRVSEVRIVFDSDLDRATLPGGDCERGHVMRCSEMPDSPVMTLPRTLAKRYTLETDAGDGFKTVFYESNNLRRSVKIPVSADVSAVRLTVSEAWGGGEARLFSFEAR